MNRGAQFYGRRGERGQVILIVTVLFSAAALAIVFGILSPTIREVQTSRDFQTSKQSYFTAEAGSEDAYYRIRNNFAVVFPETLALAGATSTVTVSPTSFNEKQILSEGNAQNIIRAVLKDLTVTDGFDFSFAMQSGIGGIYMYNNSVVNGNVYGNGPIIGNSSSPNSYNIIHGSVVSAGTSGIINQIHATSSVYAHTITHATVDKDAYYQTFSGATSSVTVGGSAYPNSPDQPVAAMPIPDSLIAQWEGDASAGGTLTCTNGSYTIR